LLAGGWALVPALKPYSEVAHNIADLASSGALIHGILGELSKTGTSTGKGGQGLVVQGRENTNTKGFINSLRKAFRHKNNNYFY
jgi:hypothetical protein